VDRPAWPPPAAEFATHRTTTAMTHHRHTMSCRSILATVVATLAHAASVGVPADRPPDRHRREQRPAASAGPARTSREPQTSTSGTLGDDPLARVQERITTRRHQIAAVLVLLAVAGGAAATGRSWAPAVVAGCVGAEIALAASLLILASDRHARSIELIADGRGDLRLPDLQHECRRLLAPAHRAELARSLHQLADEAPIRLARAHPGRPLYHPIMLAALRAELHTAAHRLEEDPIGIVGIALTELLLTAHDSPLYGSDTTRGREELARISFALQSLDDPARPRADKALTRPE
jgi:hypothetical protein